MIRSIQAGSARPWAAGRRFSMAARRASRSGGTHQWPGPAVAVTPLVPTKPLSARITEAPARAAPMAAQGRSHAAAQHEDVCLEVQDISHRIIRGVRGRTAPAPQAQPAPPAHQAGVASGARTAVQRFCGTGSPRCPRSVSCA